MEKTEMEKTNSVLLRKGTEKLVTLPVVKGSKGLRRQFLLGTTMDGRKVKIFLGLVK